MDAFSQKIFLENAIAWFAGVGLSILALLFFGMPRFHLFPPGARVDLGNVSIGQTSETAFPIFNRSSTPIIIMGWAPTCHCVQASFPQTIVPPGKSINAFVTTSATTPLGTRAAAIAIQWHFAGDSFMRTDKLVVSAKYVSPLSLSEERLNFGTVSLSDTRTKKFYVRTGNAPGNWNSLQSAPDSDRLATRIQPNASGFQIQAQLNPHGLPAGVWKSTIRLFTLQNGARTGEEVDVPVVAKIEGPFSISPSVLQFHEQTDRPLFFTLKVHSSTVPIRRMHFPGSIVHKPCFEITADGKDAVVTGSITEPANKETFVGRIPLQINDGPEGALQLSFIGYSG